MIVSFPVSCENVEYISKTDSAKQTKEFSVYFNVISQMDSTGTIPQSLTHVFVCEKHEHGRPYQH